MTSSIADLINREFERLAIGIHENPYSGISCQSHSENIEKTITWYITNGRKEEIAGKALVEIYDDYASSIYIGEDLLSYLQTLSPEEITLQHTPELQGDARNVWMIIAEFEL